MKYQSSDAESSPESRRSSAVDSLSLFLATGAGIGHLKPAPGTLGTLWGIPLALLINRLPGWYWQVAAIVLINAVGVPICASAARQMGKKDPGAVVWDELATLPMTFFCIPAGAMTLPVILLGFGLHRLLDISKFPPAKQLENLPGGWGIMADDWSAGVYSCALLHGLLYLFQSTTI